MELQEAQDMVSFLTEKIPVLPKEFNSQFFSGKEEIGSHVKFSKKGKESAMTSEDANWLKRKIRKALESKESLSKDAEEMYVQVQEDETPNGKAYTLVVGKKLKKAVSS